MQIEVTSRALDWFEKEFDLEAGDSIRIFVRYGGHGDFQQGFSLGFVKEKAKNAEIQTVEKSITFYIEHEDVWYFDGKSVKLDFDEKTEEIKAVHDVI